MITITRRLRFESGHRVFGHESKCAHPHGHSYVAWVTVTVPNLDKIGRVIDFGEIKKKLAHFIDHEWDHAFLVNPDDPLLKVLQTVPLSTYSDKNTGFNKSVFQIPRIYECRIDGNAVNPTAENLAIILYKKACFLLQDIVGLVVTKVKIQETENCLATYSPLAEIQHD